MGFLMVYTESSHVQQFFELHPGDRQQLASGPIITAYVWFHSVQLQPVVARKWSCSEKI